MFSTGSILFFGNLFQKSKFLKLKFRILINLNMQNSIVIFIFLVWKYPFCVNLIQKFKSSFFSTQNILFKSQKEWRAFCKFVQRSQHSVLFCKLVWRSQLIANYLLHFVQVIECLLMFLFRVLLDLTDEIDVFCRSFANQNT